MTEIFIKLKEGGPFFTYPLLIFIIVMLVIFVRDLLAKKDNKKTIKTLVSLGWFSFAWAFLGHTFGLITAFDSIGAAGELAPQYLGEGIKIALLNLVFGAIAFLVARLLIIILILIGKKQ